MTERNDNEDLEFQINQYLDGRMSRRKAALFQRRLQSDPDLRAELRRYAALEEHLGAMGRTELEDVNYTAQRAEIMAALERKTLLEGLQRRVVRVRLVFSALAAAAAVIVLTSGALVVFRSRLKPAPANEIAIASLLPVTVLKGEPSVDVDFRPQGGNQIPPPETHLESKIPSGTIIVSVAPVSRESTMGYPILIE